MVVDSAGLGTIVAVGRGDDVTFGSGAGNSDPSTSWTDTLTISGGFSQVPPPSLYPHTLIDLLMELDADDALLAVLQPSLALLAVL